MINNYCKNAFLWQFEEHPKMRKIILLQYTILLIFNGTCTYVEVCNNQKFNMYMYH